MSETDEAFETVGKALRDLASSVESEWGPESATEEGPALEALASLRTQLQQAEQERDAADEGYNLKMYEANHLQSQLQQAETALGKLREILLDRNLDGQDDFGGYDCLDPEEYAEVKAALAAPPPNPNLRCACE